MRREPAWRVIVEGVRSPAWNMAVDEILLAGYAGGCDRPPTLRLYGWLPPAVSLGRRQPVPSALGQDEVLLVRRATGGQAVLHDDERTYAVTGALRRPPFPGGVLDTYRRIAAALVAGLRQLGLEVEAREPKERASREQALSCFDTLGAHEIAWRGRKLVGSAQVRSRGGFLQHGSLPRSLPAERLAALLGQPVQAERFIDLARALGRSPSDDEIDAALIAGFAEAFGCRFEQDSLTEGERAAAEELARAKYATVEAAAARA